MKGYGIEIKNNLLEPKHVKAMGSSLWEYLWILDHITKVDDDGIGHVHGGAPIKLINLKADLGLTEANISRNLTKLVKEGYINTVRTPYGVKISVNKAHKRFANNVNKDLSKTTLENYGNDNSNKTVTIDSNNKTSTAPLFRSSTYLTNIPLEDIELFKTKYQVTSLQVKTKGEQLANWCEANGRTKKNYRAFLMTTLLGDYGLRTNNGYTRR